VLGISAAAVRKRISRARAAIDAEAGSPRDDIDL
jgi:DNA-directed RNA polymerase specialized sigma24 family protein